jgi:2-haloacid dehalogenase
VSAWLVSSNPFDVIGAVSGGMCAAWVKRSDEALFDPWEIEPTAIVHTLAGLPEAVRRYTA